MIAKLAANLTHIVREEYILEAFNLNARKALDRSSLWSAASCRWM